jgi:hypothetical protein
MPVRKRVDRRRAPLDLEQSAILRDEPRPEGANPFYFLRLEKDLFNEVEDLWKSHRDDILAEYVAKHPGTRPTLWWKYDAPGGARWLRDGSSLSATPWPVSAE